MKISNRAPLAIWLGAIFTGILCLGGVSLLVQQHTLHAYSAVVERIADAADRAQAAADTPRSPLAEATADGRLLRGQVGLAATVGVAALVVGALLAGYAVTQAPRPLRQLSAQLASLRAGRIDLTRRCEESGFREARQLTGQFNELLAGFQAAVEETSASSVTVADYSAQLSTAATTMAAAAEEMGAQIGSVSAATEEISTSMGGVSAGAEQMSGSVRSVATAIEQMSSSLSEVSRSSSEASGIALRADERTRVTKEIMDRLNTSAVQIGKVLDTISEISDQTNLLALNATIEAASAGEAGKGFAVVANEVKDLARQTASATEEIARQIEDMQSSTAEAARAIGEISGVISDLNRISQTIASAVEEQSATVGEIAANVQGASTAVTEVARSIQQTSEGVREISANIQGLSDASKETAASTNETHAGAEELTSLVSRQKEILERFKTRPPRFDIGPVKAAHLAWRARLENALHGHRTMTAASVASHHECQFGRWYDGAAREELARHPAYAEVGRHHERVHQLARTIIEHVEAGRREQGLERMREFEDVRRELFSSLDRLYLA